MYNVQFDGTATRGSFPRLKITLGFRVHSLKLSQTLMLSPYLSYLQITEKELIQIKINMFNQCFGTGHPSKRVGSAYCDTITLYIYPAVHNQLIRTSFEGWLVLFCTTSKLIFTLEPWA